MHEGPLNHIFLEAFRALSGRARTEQRKDYGQLGTDDWPEGRQQL
jgi:hypothetical protein